MDREAPVGSRELRLGVELDTGASAEQLESLLKVTERSCVVYQTLRNGPPIALSRGTT